MEIEDMIKGYGEEMDNRNTHWRDKEFNKKTYYKNYYDKNREHLQQQNRDRYRENIAQGESWRKQNNKKVAWSKKYYDKNKDLISITNKIGYYQNHSCRPKNKISVEKEDVKATYEKKRVIITFD
jgi:hypothetical protein